MRSADSTPKALNIDSIIRLGSTRVDGMWVAALPGPLSPMREFPDVDFMESCTDQIRPYYYSVV